MNIFMHIFGGLCIILFGMLWYAFKGEKNLIFFYGSAGPDWFNRIIGLGIQAFGVYTIIYPFLNR